VNIITISQKIPKENGSGDQHLLYHRIKALVEEGHIVYSIFFKENTESYKNSIEKLVLLGINLNEINYSYFTAFINFFRHLFTKDIPLQCSIFISKNYKKKIDDIVIKYDVSFIYISFIRVLFNAKSTKAVKYLDMIDSLSLNYHRKSYKFNILLRFLFAIEEHRIRLLEKNIFKYANKVSLVSSIDKKWIDHDQIKLIKLGVDTNVFYPSTQKNSKLTIIFSGNISYEPNKQAVVWFLERCWLEILALNPHVQLVLGGRIRPSDVIRFNKWKNVVVTGEVSSIAGCIMLADIAIAPMQSGAGMQNKILEAMSCGLPVVCTSLGMGDIRASNSVNIILAECPLEFIRSIDSLLKNKKRRDELGKAARKFIENNYSWEISNMKFINEILPKKVFN
jgi:glycosyltransferase involved in cell wall biosynthesis